MMDDSVIAQILDTKCIKDIISRKEHEAYRRGVSDVLKYIDEQRAFDDSHLCYECMEELLKKIEKIGE